jgi:hypothetical protein
VDKPQAQLPDADPFAHLTAAERFAQAVERRDALTREPRTPKQRELGTLPGKSPSVTVSRSDHNAPQPTRPR